MGTWMDGYLVKLEKVRQENIEGGGDERIAVQHDLGKLTARERILKLLRFLSVYRRHLRVTVCSCCSGTLSAKYAAFP